MTWSSVILKCWRTLFLKKCKKHSFFWVGARKFHSPKYDCFFYWKKTYFLSLGLKIVPGTLIYTTNGVTWYKNFLQTASCFFCCCCFFGKVVFLYLATLWMKAQWSALLHYGWIANLSGVNALCWAFPLLICS